MKRQFTRFGVGLMLACVLGCVAHREPDVVIAPTYSYLKTLPASVVPSATMAVAPGADR